MKFMLMMKASRDYEAGEPPNPELMAAMGPYVEKMAQRGILVETGGLFPSARGTRVSLANDSFTVTDGPFTETKEQLAGFYLIDAPNHEEALKLAAKIPPAREGSIEVRPVRELQP